MWFGLLRRSMAAPIGGGLIAFAALLALLQHYQRGNVAAGEGAGGALGSFLARLAAGAFGDVAAPIALLAMLLVGVVVAANRTLAELARPAWEHRDAVKGLRPGIALPGGSADGVDFVEAKPKSPDTGFDRIRIGFKDNLPLTMELHDTFGQLTQLTFEAFARNPTIDPALFRFSPPPGADVIGN